jgi:FAD/FMN-containing dehydrogenase/Fe-S oxidoreductase
MKKDFKYREIPYNYTSFSDKEIIIKYFDEETWDLLNELRNKRVTGRSSKLFFEILGDFFIIDRNPYIFDDFLDNPFKISKLKKLHKTRIAVIEQGTDSPLVLKLIEKTKEAEIVFLKKFREEKKRRKKISSALQSATNIKNIHFSAFHKVSHVTDASDWRVEYPEVVVYPSSIYEIPDIIKIAKNLNLKIIPRGGGTGLTGGAIPVHKHTLVINLEKLRTIGDVEIVNDNGIEIPIIETEAGVITDTITEHCEKEGYVFATDPTSAWASTIGGNIAENCGGKKCVMWGTAIDNIYSFKIINSKGEIIEVQRRNHPHRKILPNDVVIFDIYFLRKKKERKLIKSITLNGTDIRKKGVGKDITNKALGGVPGIQKEGGDGIIVSAKFILYKPFLYCRTICLEFFGNNLINASKAIVDILTFSENNKTAYLTALEHFDEKYVDAINYRNKSERMEFPKAVLLVDIESNNEVSLESYSLKLIEMVKQYNTEGFIALTPAMRESFWNDRKKLGAISRHTNAFKLNEDVVIPIDSLPSFADFIEKQNILKEMKNGSELIKDIEQFLDSLNDKDEFVQNKISHYRNHIKNFKDGLDLFTENIDKPASEIFKNNEKLTGESRSIFEVIREKILDIDIKKNIIDNFAHSFYGYSEHISKFNEAANDRITRKIIIATHMHAGDGNIHVNIPVHSNDYSMMREAEETASMIMKKTVEFGGVVSGEHGIGLTKLKFIDQSILDKYAEYKKEEDPDDIFNPGKLRSDFPASRIYTPSLNLLEMEAFILEAADLEGLTMSISSCVRCGKCKEVCNTNYPAGGMFYSPRNKILAVSLITEAVLYDVQTSGNLSFKNFKMLQPIADHCTMCHNCLKPCPVDIDFGEVSLNVKKLLMDRKRSKIKPILSLTLFYLKRKGYFINKIFRIVLLKFLFRMQRLGHYINKPFSTITSRVFPFLNNLLKSPYPKSGYITLREVFKFKGNSAFFSFQNKNKPVLKSVIYFPGCGSERMIPEISFAVIALLYNAGIRVILPPEYLCCGYPLLANGRTNLAETRSYENRVIFHRMADTISYMGINDIIVSCGTCLEMLNKYNLENVFSGSSVIDINEFIAIENLYKTRIDSKILYHNPCHTPLKKLGTEKTFNAIFSTTPEIIPNCCGEGGTMSLSRPDISNTIRTRKTENIIINPRSSRKNSVMTTCPQCVMGLSKIHDGITVKGKSMSVFAAEKFLGKNWKKDFIREIKKTEAIEKIIF